MARAAIRVTGTDEDPSSCQIAVVLADDTENFDSPSEFLATVTREALRTFKQIVIIASSRQLQARVVLGRHVGRVELKVLGLDQAATEETFRIVRGALKRGGTEGRRFRDLTVYSSGIAMTALAVSIMSGLYLLEVELPDAAVWVIIGIGSFGGIALGATLHPAIEVAPAGHTKLWRLGKLVGPIVIALLLAGATKWLFE